MKKKSTNELKNVSAKASANVSTVFSFLNFNFGNAQPTEEQTTQNRSAKAVLAGKVFAHDILVAGAVLSACPRAEDREGVIGAARDFAEGVADVLKKKGNDQKIVDNFLLGATDTINRVSGIVSDPDDES